MNSIDKDSINYQFGRLVELMKAQGQTISSMETKVDKLSGLVMNLPCREHAHEIESLNTRLKNQVGSATHKQTQTWFLNSKIVVGIVVAIITAALSCIVHYYLGP